MHRSQNYDCEYKRTKGKNPPVKWNKFERHIIEHNTGNNNTSGIKLMHTEKLINMLFPGKLPIQETLPNDDEVEVR